MTELVSIDARAFKKFSAAMRKANPELARGLRKNLRAAAELVAADARARAAFSSRIPKTIKPQVAGGRVAVKAGGPDAPDAAPLENKGRQGTFRHPLWGNWEWKGGHSEGKTGDPRVQKARPFLHPALEAKRAEAEALAARSILAALEIVAREGSG